jgi:hypothetical protein
MSPYIVREGGSGSGTVYKKTNGLKKVGHSTKHIKSYARTLRALEHGWKPKGRKK